MTSNASVLSVGKQTRISYKCSLSAAVVVAAVLLPAIMHAAAGQSGGATWLPMYIPVIIGGALLGTKWGLAVGILSPAVSYLITTAAGTPMPTAVKLPYMMAELAVFATVAGMFSHTLARRKLSAFPAVIAAALTGRTAFIAMAYLFQGVLPLAPQAALAQVWEGIPGLLLQFTAVPPLLMALSGRRHSDSGSVG